jgi:hypothetical protein
MKDVKRDPGQVSIEGVRTLLRKVQAAGIYVPYQEPLNIPETDSGHVAEAMFQEL